MHIRRMIHVGSVSLALAAPLLVLGGCDSGGGGSGTSVAKETPQDADARAKMISDAYKSKPAPKGESSPKH